MLLVPSLSQCCDVEMGSSIVNGGERVRAGTIE